MTEEGTERFNDLTELKEIAGKREDQKKLMIENGDNSHEMLGKENYTDPQHFVFELLQNAEDENATEVCFEIQKEKLIFSHNSDHLFDLDDIVAISNFAYEKSPKRKRENAIGQYGIGFKSVYAITNEPRIQSGIFDVSILQEFIPKINDENFCSNKTIITLPLKEDNLYDLLLEKFENIKGEDEIIFLNNITELRIIINNKDIVYRKTEQDNILTIKKNDEIIGKYFYLDKKVSIENKNLTIKIVFGIENDKIIPLQKPLYVFFPTKDDTNLSFALHAPFKLATHTREHIDEKDPNNISLLERLATLFIENLILLRDKGYIDVDFFRNIFPINEYITINAVYGLFYKKCLEKIRTNQSILPTNDNDFAGINDVMLIGSNKLVSLLSKDQLNMLFNRQNWISDKITSNVNHYIWRYLRNLQVPDVDLKYFLSRMNENFLKEQSDEWLIDFYKTFCEIKYNTEKNVNEVTEITHEETLRGLPIIRTKEGKQVLPENVFLPIDNQQPSASFPTVKDSLVKDKTIESFLKKLGIHKPTDKDEIRKIIKENSKLGDYFNIIFDYWKEEKPQQIIDDIRDSKKQFVKIRENDDYHIASELYFPTDDLEKYFSTKPETKFVDLDFYYNFINVDDRRILKKFLLEIGINEFPIIKKDKSERTGQKVDGYQQKQTVKEDDRIIDGSDAFMVNFCQEKSLEKSLLFLRIISNYRLEDIKGEAKARSRFIPDYRSTAVKLIQDTEWLLNKDGKFVAPHEVTIGILDESYNGKINEHLVQLLGIIDSVDISLEDKEWNELSKEEKKKLLASRKKNEGKQNSNTSTTNSNSNTNYTSNNSENNYDYDRTKNILDSYIQKLDSSENSEDKIENKISEIREGLRSEIGEDKKDEITDEEWCKKIEEKIKEEQKKFNERKSLIEKLKNNTYSYKWFKSYLELLLTYNESQSTVLQKSLSFSKIKQYVVDGKSFDKYFLLLDANSYIPSSIEDSKDFKITLLFRDQSSENIHVESISKRGQDLLIKSSEITSDIIGNFHNIVNIQIRFTPVIDLLSKLKNAFVNSNYIETWIDIKESIPALQYIYGPPGTGKTTTLCKKISSILKEKPKSTFLILTPTNKASDVLCKKLNELNSSIDFARLGSATDPELEKQCAYRDSLSVNDLFTTNVIASTIQRLPYFEVNQSENNGSKKLFQVHWDYVILDESSMIGLPYIVFAIFSIYKTNPQTKFIIAGDPKQIPPVIEINDDDLENFDFQEENIYKMMGLDSFHNQKQVYKEKQIIRPQDNIEPLERQYRSVKKIGQLFSELSYSEFLQHDREENPTEENKQKSLPEEFQKLFPTNVTFIDIPLNKSSVYKVNKLNGSSYQTYSSILVTEIIKYFDSVNKNEKWKIGLIAPYKAQAILLNKLISCYGTSENIEIYADTVHGFQGDECDIIFFICNPNSYKYTGNPKCLLSKEYIYNVAISRARDYLIILYPFSTIGNNGFINRAINSYKKNFDYLQIIQSADIEKKIFNGNSKFIYNNSDCTGHDNVNVFGLTDMKYFVKSNDNAIDIQLKVR